MELRGAGPHNKPRLDCPKVTALQARLAASLTGDRSMNDTVIAAVRQCAERLRVAGVDPADFDVTQAAADVEDLRKAIGIESWSIAGSYGTSSRYLTDYLRAFPGRVQAAYLDSPWSPRSTT